MSDLVLAKVNKLAMPMTNLLKNSNFADGVTGWDINAETYDHTIDKGVLTLERKTISSSLGILTDSAIAFSGNMYAACDIKAHNSGADEISFQFSGLSNKLVSSPTADTWYHVSVVIGAPYTSSYRVGFRFSFPENEVLIGYKMSIKNLVLFDIREVFGKGNEPTKAEMDALLTYFPNSWFDRTRNISQALSVLTLNKLRNLETLVTALGGGS